MRFLFTIICLAIIFTPLSANAGMDHTVTQKGKFNPTEIEIKAGDSITFVNDDKTRHNVYSKSVGQKFNIRKQKPGDRDSVFLTAPAPLKCVAPSIQR